MCFTWKDCEGKEGLANVSFNISCFFLKNKYMSILFRYALKYFSYHPSVFEDIVNDVPKKKKKDETQVTELDIVETCFFLLRSNPDFYRNKWNWSIFIQKYLNYQDNRIKW